MSRALLDKMETREFIYLKQVMALVILELWHQIFIDKERGGGTRRCIVSPVSQIPGLFGRRHLASSATFKC